MTKNVAVVWYCKTQCPICDRPLSFSTEFRPFYRYYFLVLFANNSSRICIFNHKRPDPIATGLRLDYTKHEVIVKENSTQAKAISAATEFRNFPPWLHCCVFLLEPFYYSDFVFVFIFIVFVVTLSCTIDCIIVLHPQSGRLSVVVSNKASDWRR